ncbi:hypothetical protein IW261DRAFT_573913 [Armillaria novae-zelandiae]|uniref:Uncharacterized protein n=1 Tax=Armillaria novae-zelandiae TaxID=153914 RepID=A0AA39UD37_9AGAR|nr:hypothetical protein IW261DRAFT_573913 [Armillaria novae-zelandiae]
MHGRAISHWPLLPRACHARASCLTLAQEAPPLQNPYFDSSPHQPWMSSDRQSYSLSYTSMGSIRPNHRNPHHHSPRRVLRCQVHRRGRFMAVDMGWSGKSYQCYWLVNTVLCLRVFLHRLSSNCSKCRRICLIYKLAFIWKYNSYASFLTFLYNSKFGCRSGEM